MDSASKTASKILKLGETLLLVMLMASLLACGSDSKDTSQQTVPSQTTGPTITSPTPQTKNEVTPTASPTPPPTTDSAATLKPSPTPTPIAVKAVSVSDKGNYFQVILDYTSGKSPKEIMAEYGQVLSDQSPGIQAGIDQFLYDLINDGIDMYIEILGIPIPAGLGPLFDAFAVDLAFIELVQRVADVLPQLPESYLAELEGLASTLADTDKNKLGDSHLSADELYFYNIFPDVSRVYQCSAIGIFGPLSESGSTIVGRNFDLETNLPHYSSITEIRNGDQANSVYLIGWLANLNAYTAFNDQGIFGAIVDTTGSREPYASEGIYSYMFDLRYALENQSSLQGVADTMSQHPYAFNHLVFLADSEKSQILENNISGTGSDMHRALRSSDSELNPGISWGFENAIVAVSAFMLAGNHDNFIDMGLATERLQSYKTLLDQAKANDNKVNWDEIKNIQSYDGPDGIPGDMEEGDLYNYGTRRIVVFEPATFRLEVFFVQTATPPNNPGSFDVIEVSFGKDN